MMVLNSTFINAQDNRNQYPSILSNAYFDINIGYINYPFSNASLPDGLKAQEISVPHAAVSITLFGYRFNKYLAAQVSYMRPVEWVLFKDVTGDKPGEKHSVWMSYGGLTLKGLLPLSEKFSAFGEGGLGLITRHGFGANPQIVKNAEYASFLFGAGVKYHINPKFDLSLSTTWSPANNEVKQPYTIFHSVGFTYNMRPLSAEKIIEKQNAGYIFPHHLLQIGFSSNAVGYGVNDVFTNGPIPVFWAGLIYVKKGISLSYQQNIYHTKKVFSLDWGANASYWQSDIAKDNFYTLSLFPVLRFTFLHTKAVDYYFNYSVAGPSYISKIDIDNKVSGKNFTFQDFMGIGCYVGVNRKLNAEFKIVHYSNGNIFPDNPGVTIPLTFSLGYTF